MAGGAKETPRQKMIGMMYLVLTALLALQVSNAVLEKFVFIDESLQASLILARANSGATLKGIEGKVAESKRTDDQAVLNKALEVRKKTDEIIKMLDDARQEIVTASGGKDPETGKYIGEKSYDEVNRVMLGEGEGGNGRAYKLRPLLDKYAVDISKIDDSLKTELSSFIPFTKDPKDIPQMKGNSNLDGFDWEKMSFLNTPTVAALAVISQIQNEVAKIETKAIEGLAAQIGAGMVKFDIIQAKVTAESRVVAAGTKYKAWMFIAASASNVIPRMTSSAGGVKVDPKTGVGEIEFTAQGGGYDNEGKAKKKWQGSITFKGPRGDTTFKVDEEYTVVKPVIDIQAAAVSALYLNCGNELNVQVPALGATYDPRITASDNAQVINGARKGLVTIVPKSAKTTLTVYSSGNLIGTKDFKVRLIPKPEIELRANGKAIDEKQGGACPRSIEAKAVPDQSFKDFLPKDARYRVTQWEITLARGKRAVRQQKFSGPTANLGEIAGEAKEGDRLVIEVKGVQRANFREEIENVNVGTVIKTYPITQ